MAPEQNDEGSSYQASAGFATMIPPLDGSTHKGQHGKVAVVGGSTAYTGAPYFAAFSAMQVGADYGNVYCTKEAGQVIKAYSPELVVFPVMKEMSHGYDFPDAPSTNFARSLVSRSSCVVIGPGLSRDPLMIHSAIWALTEAIERGVPVVMDADGITVAGQWISKGGGGFQGVTEAVFTPNVPEFWRLCDACGIRHDKVQPHDDSNLVQELTDALHGPVIVAKGRHDTICRPGGNPVLTTGKGSPRRCGGQGDVLSGTLGTTTSWAVSHASKEGLSVSECIAEAARNACELVRVAQEQAFEERGRSMVASDIMKCLQPAVAECWSL